MLLSPGNNTVVGVYRVELHIKQSVMFYAENKTKFVKIYVTLPRYMTSLRQHFEREMVPFKK